MAEDSPLRESLARDRTHLANERTFLAYIRTGLGFLLTGALIIRFEQTQIAYVFSIIPIAIGFFLLILGLFRFIKLKNKIDKEKS